MKSSVFVAALAKELAKARREGGEARTAEIHARFTYRMHNLSEFMKPVLQRFTRWFNREHKGLLWSARALRVGVP